MSVDDAIFRAVQAATGGDSINSWRWRRAFLFGNALLCWVAIFYILLARLQTAPADTAMFALSGYLITATGAYVFGAAWETNRARQTLGTEGTAASLGVTLPPEPPKPAPQTTVVLGDRRGAKDAGSATVETTVKTTTQTPAPAAAEDQVRPGE